MYWYSYNSISSAIDGPMPCTTLAAHRFDKKQFSQKTFNARFMPIQPCTTHIFTMLMLTYIQYKWRGKTKNDYRKNHTNGTV